jgi:hypothetical protein
MYPGDERSKRLVRSVLDVVPLDTAIEAFYEKALEANQAEPMLAVAALRGERAKPRIEARSGLSESTAETGKRLRKSSETIRNWIDRGALIAYRAADDPTRLRLPLWQFDGGSVRPWVAPLIEAYGDNGWGLVDFVTVPRAALGGAPYLHGLLSGRHAQLEATLKAARRADPD